MNNEEKLITGLKMLIDAFLEIVAEKTVKHSTEPKIYET